MDNYRCLWKTPYRITTYLFLAYYTCISYANVYKSLDVNKVLIWGPGLESNINVPVRYIFIQAVDKDGQNFTESIGEKAFQIEITDQDGRLFRAGRGVLDRHDGSYIARYKLYTSPQSFYLIFKHNGIHVAKSPYLVKGNIHHETCNCPSSMEEWLNNMKCPQNYRQIDNDLRLFHKDKVDLKKMGEETVNRFNRRSMHSLCHYKIINNKIYRKTYGEHVGFKMFSDSILLSLTRKVKLPDVEFFVNLGDWPLVKKNVAKPVPIFSWCGSEETYDVIMPTYDITDSTLKMFDRVMLDTITVQGNSGPSWQNKTPKALWRGRDSRQERLDLVIMSRRHPDLIDAALTHMFFFKKDPEKYGELQKSISFFDFFKYKYQLNIDGTVAAYRLPYLLGGDAVVLKQDSQYYEHFYKDLVPYEHYIPFKRDLSDLMQQLQWAKDNDEKAQQIARNARDFVRDNLLPVDIFCYHVTLLEAYSKLLKEKPQFDDTFELVEQPDDHTTKCNCQRLKKDEL